MGVEIDYFALANIDGLQQLIDALEEDDDVQTVTANFDIPEEVAAKLDA